MEKLLRMFLDCNISTIYKNTSRDATRWRLREALHTNGRLDFSHLFHLLCRETGATQRQAFCAIGFRIESVTCLVRSICSTPFRHRGFGEVQRTVGYHQHGADIPKFSNLFFRLSLKILANSKYWTDGSWPNTRIVSGESFLA